MRCFAWSHTSRVCVCVRVYELLFRCLTGIQAKNDACAPMAIKIRVSECNRKIGKSFMRFGEPAIEFVDGLDVTPETTRQPNYAFQVVI